MEFTSAGNVAEIVQAIASICGLVVIYVQIRHLIRSIRGTTQDNIYAHYNDICKMLFQQSELRPYFYDGKTLAEAGPEGDSLRPQVDYLSEMILGVIEHAVVQENNLPVDAWETCWRPYARERLKKGTEMRRFFDENKDWYTSALREAVEEFDREEKASGRLEPATQVGCAALRANPVQVGMFESV